MEACSGAAVSSPSGGWRRCFLAVACRLAETSAARNSSPLIQTGADKGRKTICRKTYKAEIISGVTGKDCQFGSKLVWCNSLQSFVGRCENCKYWLWVNLADVARATQ